MSDLKRLEIKTPYKFGTVDRKSDEFDNIGLVYFVVFPMCNI